MNESEIWKAIETYAGVLGPLIDVSQKLEKASKETATATPIQAIKIKEISEKTTLAQEGFLEDIVSNLNALVVPLPIDEVRERIAQLVEKQYSRFFEGMITGTDRLSQSHCVFLVNAYDRTKRELKEMIARINRENGEYVLAK